MEDKDLKGALKDVVCSQDHNDARDRDMRSKLDTLGAVKLKFKQEVFNKIDGKVASCLANPALTKAIGEWDEPTNQLVDYKCYLRCTKDNIRGCSDDCSVFHNNLDNIADFEDPNFAMKRLPLLARYISAKADSFIKHLIKDRVKDYTFWFEFEEERVFLAGYVWLHQYENINADITLGKLTNYLDVTKEIEKVNISREHPMGPTAALDMNVLSDETTGTVKNLEKLRQKITQVKKYITSSVHPNTIN